MWVYFFHRTEMELTVWEERKGKCGNLHPGHLDPLDSSSSGLWKKLC